MLSFLLILLIDSNDSIIIILLEISNLKLVKKITGVCISQLFILNILQLGCSHLILLTLYTFPISSKIIILNIFSVTELNFNISNLTPPLWVTLFGIILSNDIETNPGDSFFNFCTRNLNSLAKDNFNRFQLLEAHNSIFNYDLISLCESSLNDSVELPDPFLENYTFVSCNNPNNTKHPHSQYWWSDGNTTPEGKEIDVIISMNQLILNLVKKLLVSI